MTKTARAARALVIGSEHVARVPRQAPDQRAKRQPATGTARRETALYDTTESWQCAVHATEEKLARTVPRPATEIVNGNVAGAKSAVTVVTDARPTVQSNAPVQPPDQRTNRMPGPATALSVTDWFASQSDSHDVEHAMPGTSLVTVPTPLTTTERCVGAASRWRSQRESWMSSQEPEWP